VNPPSQITSPVAKSSALPPSPTRVGSQCPCLHAQHERTNNTEQKRGSQACTNGGSPSSSTSLLCSDINPLKYLTVLTFSSSVASSSQTKMVRGCIWNADTVHMWLTPSSMALFSARALCAPVIRIITWKWTPMRSSLSTKIDKRCRCMCLGAICHCQCVDLYSASTSRTPNLLGALVPCERKCLAGASTQLLWSWGCRQGPIDCSRRPVT